MSNLLVLWTFLSPFAILGCLKGRYALSVVGVVVLFGIPAILAATRLARADSWWAKRYYNNQRLAEATERYRSGSQISSALTL